MKKLLKFWPSLLLIMLAGLTGCAAVCGSKPHLGAAFVDAERDLEGSRQRLAEFDVVCVAPTRKDPPEAAMAPAWCEWTKAADRSIRANNAIARD